MTLATFNADIVEQQINISIANAEEIADYYRKKGGYAISLVRDEQNIQQATLTIKRDHSSTIKGEYRRREG